MSCEYTVHPQWLADNNDGAELWPDNLPKQSSQDEMELVQDEVVIEEPAPIDFNWSEEHEHEEQSICEDIILEQDIPATLEEEVVTNSGTEAEYDDNSDQSSLSPGIDRRPSINNSDTNRYTAHRMMYGGWTKQPRSLLKSNTFAEHADRPLPKFKQTLLVSKSLLKLNQYQFNASQTAGPSLLKPKHDEKKVIASDKKQSVPATKFKESVALIKRNIPAPQHDRMKNLLKRAKDRRERPRKQSEPKKAIVTSGKGSNSKRGSGGSGKTGGAGKMFVDLHGENITINHEADNTFRFDEINLSIKVPIESEVVSYSFASSFPARSNVALSFCGR